MQINNIKAFTDTWRGTFPNLYRDKTDEEIFSLLQERHPDLGIPNYTDALASVPQPTQKRKEESLNDVNTDPSFMNNWFTTGDFIPDRFQEEGFMGVSPEFFQDSYNKSMAGMAYKAMTGKEKYTVKDYEPALWKQGAQFLVGMASPLELATMIGTGYVGKGLATLGRGTLFGGTKFLEKGLLTKLAGKSTGGVAAAEFIDGAISMGIGGGGFSAAHALTHDVANQRMAETDEEGKGIGEVNIKDAMVKASDEFLHSLPMFAIAGGVTSGLMGTLYGYSQVAMKKGSKAQRMAQAVSHPAARAGEEALLFTSLPQLLGDEDAPKFGTSEWWGALGANAVVIGGMRAVGSFAEHKDFDAFKFITNEMKMQKAYNKSMGKSSKNIKDNLPSDAPKELRDFVRETILKGQDLEVSTIQGVKDLKFIRDMNKKLEDPAYRNEIAQLIRDGNIKDKKVQEWGEYARLSNIYQQGTLGIVESLLQDDTMLENSYQQYYGKAPNKQELQTYRSSLENWRDNMLKTSEWMDDYMGGNWKDSKDGNKGAKPDYTSIEKNTVPSEVRVGGTGKSEAKKTWSDKKIRQEMKKNNIDEGEILFKADGKSILNKDSIIDRIFKKKETAELKGKAEREQLVIIQQEATRKALKEAGLAGKSQAEVSIDVKTQKLLEPNNDRVLEIQSKEKKNVTKQDKEFLATEKIKEEIRISDLSNENKELLAFSLAKSGRNLSSAHTKEAIELLKFVEKKYPGENIMTLDKARKQTLVSEYINDIVGFEYLSPKTGEVLKRGTLEKTHGFSAEKIYALHKLYRKKIEDLKEHFHFGAFKDKDLVGFDIMQPFGKALGFPKKIGRKEIAIRGGEQGLYKIASTVRNIIKVGKKKIKEFVVGKKKISAEEASLLIDVASYGKARPGEIAGIRVKDIQFNSKGMPELIGVTAPGKVFRQMSIEPRAAKLLKNFIEKNNLKPADKLFNLKNSSEVSALMKEVYEVLPNNLKPEIYDSVTGKFYKWGTTESFKDFKFGDETVAGGKVMSKADAASAFRRLNENLDISRAGHKTWAGKLHYQKIGAPKPLQKKPGKQQKREESEVIFETKGDLDARAKFLRKFAKKNKLSDEQLQEMLLKEGVLGEFAETGEGIIRLQEGLWQPSDFFHENTHRLKAYARETNNKSLMKLIKRAEGLAKKTKQYKEWKKKNPNRNVEEFLADVAGGKASRMEFSTGMLTKIKQIVKQMVSKIKTIFGKGNFNDYANVIAKRAQKGFSTKGVEFARNQIKYRMAEMSPKEQLSYAKNSLRELFKGNKLSKSKEKDMARWIGDLAQLGDNFKLGKDTPLDELQTFVATLNSLGKEKIKAMPNKKERFELVVKSEKMRLLKNITEERRKSMLKDLEVVNGEIFNANSKQLSDFIEIMHTMDDVSKSTTTWIDEQIASNRYNKKIADRFKRWSYAKAVLPVSTMLESIGLKKLSNLMKNHVSQELKHIGKFSDFEKRMANMFGSKKWDKVKDFVYLFDKERYFERLDTGILKTAEKRFIESAINTKTWKPKTKGKEVTLLKEYNKLMDYYKNELIGKNGILKEILNEAEYEKFMKDNPIKFIEDNIYVQRRLTREAKEYYNPYGKHYEKLVEEQAKAISKNMAKEWYVEKKGKDYKPSKKELEDKAIEFTDNGAAKSIAYSDIAGLVDFVPGKMSPSFLKSRHTKLPEFIDVGGKKIQTYETNFGLTVKDYAIGQAKFLANAEFFPEFVKFKGFNKSGQKEILGKLQVADPAMSKWVKKRLEDHLNIDKEHRDYPNGIRMVRYTTSFMAKTQLSFPTSGLKNFLVGSTQSLLAFRLRDFFGGFIDAIYRDNQALVRLTGATEIGMRHFEMKGLKGKVDKIAEKGFFRFGLMRPSENLNRYVSVLASRREQAHLSNVLRTSGEKSRAYKKALTKLSDFYHLDKREIALLKKFGMNGVKGFDAKIAGANRRAVENLYQKMNTYAHINTQGASINLFMPDWAAGELAQSALLYKRMAYAATTNTVRSLNIARKNKSLLQPIMFGLGAYMSGNALIGFYDTFLGQTMPKENSNEENLLRTILWKGEFLGIVSEFLNPFRNEGLGMQMYPAILSTIGVNWNTMGSMIHGDKFVSQGVFDILKKSTGLFNNTSKLLNQGLLAKDSYASQSKRFRKLYYDMLEEYKDRDEIAVQNQTKMTFERSKYMQAFWNVFESGYSKDLNGNSLGKWYMMSLFAKANDYYFSGIDEDGMAITSENQAMRKAVKSMRTSITKMNPNKGKVTAKTLTGMVSQTKKALQFYKWLDKKKPLSKELKKLENQYGARVRLLEKSIMEYIKSAKLENDLDHYNINIKKLLF